MRKFYQTWPNPEIFQDKSVAFDQASIRTVVVPEKGTKKVMHPEREGMRVRSHTPATKLWNVREGRNNTGRGEGATHKAQSNLFAS
jgi:hypothetical protein